MYTEFFCVCWGYSGSAGVDKIGLSSFNSRQGFVLCHSGSVIGWEEETSSPLPLFPVFSLLSQAFIESINCVFVS